MPAPRTLCTAPRLPAERPLGCVAPPPSYQAVSNLLAQGSLEDVAAAYTSWSGIAESELADTHYDVEVKVGTRGKAPRYEYKQPQYPQYGRPSAGPAARAVRALASLARHARQVLAASLAQGRANPQAKPLAKGLANAAVACGNLALSRWATAALAVADVTVAHAANGRALLLIDELVAQAEVFCNGEEHKAARQRSADWRAWAQTSVLSGAAAAHAYLKNKPAVQMPDPIWTTQGWRHDRQAHADKKWTSGKRCGAAPRPCSCRPHPSSATRCSRLRGPWCARRPRLFGTAPPLGQISGS